MEPKDGSWEVEIKWLMLSFTVKGEGWPPTPIDSANKHLFKEKNRAGNAKEASTEMS